MNAYYRWYLLLVFGPLFLIANVSSSEEGNTWAILIVAITDDYAAEASLYKTYHLLRRGGVPSRNIIVFSPDEVAYSRWNVHQGAIFYGTYSVNDRSEDVYIGSENIDYAGENNTGHNFLAVLRGDEKEAGSRKVLKTDPDDRVLIYYIGYGSTGVITFPQYKDYIFADTLIPLLEDLIEDRYFRKLLIIFEVSCAGSNFDDYLTQNQNIIAVTSVGRTGRYRSCFLEPFINEYTALCFSYHWLSFVEKVQRADLNEAGYTVLDQFNYAKNVARGEYFNMYGNLDAASKNKITDFYGNGYDKNDFYDYNNTFFRRSSSEEPVFDMTNKGKASVIYKVKHNKDVYNGIDKSMYNIFKNSINWTSTDKELDSVLQNDFLLTMSKFDCYRKLISSLHDVFPDIEDKYLMEHHYSKLAKLCSLNVPEDKVIESMVTEYEKSGSHFY